MHRSASAPISPVRSSRHGKRTSRPPAYRRQKSKGRPDRAFVVLEGQRVYLGDYGSPESHEAYRRALAEGRSGVIAAAEPPDAVQVVVICNAFLKHAERRYGPEGGYMHRVRVAVRGLRELYGHTPAAAFDPRRFKAVRQQWIDRGLAAKTINDYGNIVREIFRWGAEEGLIPGRVCQDIDNVKRLPRRQEGLAKPKEIGPADRRLVRCARRHLATPVRILIDLALLCGARTGELVQLRGDLLDRSRPVWTFRPPQHKNLHRDESDQHARILRFGPRAQRILASLSLDGPPGDRFFFDPRDGAREMKARHARKGKPRRADQKPGPRESDRTIGDHYTTDSIRRAIERACDAAFPPLPRMKEPAEIRAWRRRHRFTPHQLRKSAATRFDRLLGAQASSLVLGHSSETVTRKHYIKKNDKAADRAMLAIG